MTLGLEILIWNIESIIKTIVLKLLLMIHRHVIIY